MDSSQKSVDQTKENHLIPTSAPAIENVALEVHPDTAPPRPISHPSHNKKEKYELDKKKKKKRINLRHSQQLEEHGVTEPPSIMEQDRDEKKNSLGAQKNSSTPLLFTRTGNENDASTNKKALQLAPATGEELPSPMHMNINLGPFVGTRQYNTRESITEESNREEQKEHEEIPQIFTVDNAFRVLTPEEQRLERMERERKKMPLIEGKPVPSRSPSLTPSEQEAQQVKKENRRLVILFIVCAIILVAILVPSLLLTNKKKNNSNAAITLPSSSPSTSLVPSFSPSLSIVPSSFPTTSSPTSTTFNDVVSLLGLNEETISLDPNDYVFRSIQWMSEQDQITQSVLIRQQTAGEQRDASEALVQRFVIVSLYFATEGDSWFDPLGFLNPFTHECEWRVFGREQFLLSGATIDCVDNVVQGIALNDNNLGGIIPSEIGLLTQLTWLELNRNQIGGTLPSALSQLSRLESLFLEGNKLSGSIPSEITSLNNLGILWLALNDLTGSIPESIGDLNNLTLLFLANNFLTGSIPLSIQNMTMLRILALTSNMLTSTLPTEINNFQQLATYAVQGNLLTGTLPFEAGANPSLGLFSCSFNAFMGDISRLTHLSSVTSLGLAGNKFTGTIPTEICNFPLRRINGVNNRLTGSLPDCLGDLTLLRSLIIANNSLVGSIPTLPTSLESLTLWGNQLTGTIPTGPFPRIRTLSLAFNNFTIGTMPTELATLTNLKNLHLDDCRLTGNIHTEIGLLTQLTNLNLGGNRLFGTIPSEIGLLQNLEELGLSVNVLTGTIPTEMGRLTSLRELYLNANSLTGPLPSTFTNLPVETFGQLTLHSNDLMDDIGFFCQDRSFGLFFADCLKLTNCTCCTTCCDRGRSAVVDNSCLNTFNNL